MRKLPQRSSQQSALDAIAVHANSLRNLEGETTRNDMHAHLCAERQVDLHNQELRSFLVKQSVVRIHCVVAFAMILIAAALFLPLRAQLDRDVLKTLLLVAGSAIGSSVLSIGRAVANPRS